ncbi:MAG: hypothetical protein AABX17_00815 [Nanoarchaeota archaeon]
MDSFIKKIFTSKTENDEIVHVQFQKFSRGEFKDKAVIKYRHSKDKYSVSTTYEYSNEFARAMAEKLGANKTKVTGVIVSTRDLTGQLNFSGKKQFAGVKQYIMDTEMSGNDILTLLNKLPTAFFALSMIVDGAELKTRPKAPISGKPSTKGGDAEIKADFCKLITTDKHMIDKFVFDSEINDSTKKAEIKHIFQITNITVPKGETDPLKMRENAKRSGKIVRIITIDGKRSQKEHDFVA